MCVCVLKKDIDSVLQILQVPFDTTQRVTQLSRGPLNLSASVFAKLTPTQIESSCFVQRFEDLTATIELGWHGMGYGLQLHQNVRNKNAYSLTTKNGSSRDMTHAPSRIYYLRRNEILLFFVTVAMSALDFYIHGFSFFPFSAAPLFSCLPFYAFLFV